MKKEEMQKKISEIIDNKNGNGIEMFVALKAEEGYKLKKLRATDKLNKSVSQKIIDTLRNVYLDGEIEYEVSENIADNKKALYEIIQDEGYSPFGFLQECDLVTDVYSDTDRERLSGYLFKINLNEKYLWVYQHVYSMSRIDRSKNIFALFNKNTYDEIENDVLQISSRADMVIIEGSIITSKIELLQKCFGFEKFIRAGAQRTISIIKELDIVTGLDKFMALENKSKLTNAKKLLKAKNSPVLKMKKTELISSIKKHTRYSAMFVIEDDKIKITSQKDAAAFIKMVNDDIVKSELTGQEYDSSSKSLLEPVASE